MNREDREKMKAAKEGWSEVQCKNRREGNEVRKQKESYNILKALTKARQPKSAVIEDSSGSLKTESTADQTGRLSAAVAYTTTNFI